MQMKRKDSLQDLVLTQMGALQSPLSDQHGSFFLSQGGL